jgi:hypothetical protein
MPKEAPAGLGVADAVAQDLAEILNQTEPGTRAAMRSRLSPASLASARPHPNPNPLGGGLSASGQA